MFLVAGLIGKDAHVVKTCGIDRQTNSYIDASIRWTAPCMGLTQLTLNTDGLEVKDKPQDESKSQATASWAFAFITAQLE